MKYTQIINIESVPAKVQKKITPKSFQRYLRRNNHAHTINEDGTVHFTYYGGDLMDYVIHVNIAVNLPIVSIVADVPDFNPVLGESDLARLKEQCPSSYMYMDLCQKKGMLLLHGEYGIDCKDMDVDRFFCTIIRQATFPVLGPFLCLIGSVRATQENG